MARKLTGILSRRTVVEQLPMVEDAAAEMARIAEESAPAKEKEEA